MTAFFWIGGNGTWDGTNALNWSLSSGGLPTVSAPTSADTVTFDSNSGAGTCTTASGAVCSTLTLNSAGVDVALGANLTATNGTTLSLGALSLGSFTLTTLFISSFVTAVRSIAYGSGKIVLTGNNLNCWGVTATNFSLSGSRRTECTYAGATGTRTLLHGPAGATEANAPDFYVTAGTDIIDYTVARTIDFTGFSGTLDNARIRTVYGSYTISTGMTVTGGGNQTNFAGTTSQSITTSGKTLDMPLSFSGVGGSWTFIDALTQGSTRNFTFSNGTIRLLAGATSTVGNFRTALTTQKSLQSTSPGNQATLSQASGTVSVNNLTIRDINAAGGAIWKAPLNAGNIDGGNNSGWSFIPSGESGSRAAMSLGLSISL